MMRPAVGEGFIRPAIVKYVGAGNRRPHHKIMPAMPRVAMFDQIQLSLDGKTIAAAAGDLRNWVQAIAVIHSNKTAGAMNVNTAVSKMDAGDLMIFDHRLLHQSQPGTDKIIIRTELIYEAT